MDSSYTPSAIIRHTHFTGGASKDIATLLKSKGTFMAAVFATLIAQLAFTFYVMHAIGNDPSVASKVKSWFLVIFLAQIAILFILALVPMPMIAKLLLFTVFSGLSGMLLSNLNSIPQSVLNAALLGTIGVFVTTFIMGLALTVAGVDMSWMGGYLLAALLGLLIAQIVMLFFTVSSTMHKIILYIGLALFSVYIVYDTNVMLGRDYQGDYVTGAMDYYLDFINVFVRLVDLMNS